MWLCGLSCIASMGRMVYAFARDDAMPGSAMLKGVHPEHRTPDVAICVTSALTVALCLYAAAFYVVTSISTIALYVAYVIPTALNLRNKRRGTGEFSTPRTAPWSLGKWGPAINAIAVAWVAFLVVIFSLPPNELVLWTFLGLMLFLGVYWLAGPARHFRGPSREVEDELRQMDRAVEA
jgi:amino acid transporter